MCQGAGASLQTWSKSEGGLLFGGGVSVQRDDNQTICTNLLQITMQQSVQSVILYYQGMENQRMKNRTIRHQCPLKKANPFVPWPRALLLAFTAFSKSSLVIYGIFALHSVQTTQVGWVRHPHPLSWHLTVNVTHISARLTDLRDSPAPGAAPGWANPGDQAPRGARDQMSPVGWH